MRRKVIEMAGKQYGQLTVIRRGDPRHASRGAFWLCQCECGSETVVQGAALRNGSVKSCGCSILAADRVGERHGHLTITGRSGERGGSPLWICRCDCGAIVEKTSTYLRKVKLPSCGCQAFTNHVDHGHAPDLRPSPTYVTWTAMKQRCTNQGHKDYDLYGGRGVTICDAWLHSFETFLSDMGERPAGTSIDRIDPNGNYEPGNCRWADAKTQANNKRNARAR